jgi:hypothetical protein
MMSLVECLLNKIEIFTMTEPSVLPIVENCIAPTFCLLTNSPNFVQSIQLSLCIQVYVQGPPCAVMTIWPLGCSSSSRKPCSVAPQDAQSPPQTMLGSNKLFSIYSLLFTPEFLLRDIVLFQSP